MMDLTLTNVVLSVAIGVVSSLTASAAFLFVLFRFRPNIEISPYISVGKDSDGNTQYRIKIVNRTPRKIINVRVKLILGTKVNIPGGIITNNKQLMLRTPDLFHVGKYSKKDKGANYAYRFITDEDIESLWQEGQGNHIKFLIIATDSLTGFSKVFFRRFHVKRTTLVTGSHIHGDSLEVK